MAPNFCFISGLIWQRRRELAYDDFDQFKNDNHRVNFIQEVFPNQEWNKDELTVICDCVEGIRGKICFHAVAQYFRLDMMTISDPRGRKVLQVNPRQSARRKEADQLLEKFTSYPYVFVLYVYFHFSFSHQKMFDCFVFTPKYTRVHPYCWDILLSPFRTKRYNVFAPKHVKHREN